MTNKQREFLHEIEQVSGALGKWVQNCFHHNWSIEDVKIALRAAHAVIEKDVQTTVVPADDRD